MVSKDIIQALRGSYSGDIHDCLDQLGIWGALEGLTLYGALPASGRLCGPASTVQFQPCNRRVISRRYHQAIDTSAGSVLVVDTKGAVGSCTGELMCTGAKVHGALGTIVNGTIRDLERLQGLDYPVFAKGVLPAGAVGRMEDIAAQVEVRIGRIRIKPGDLVFADRDGVVVIPQEVADTVAQMTTALGREENRYRSEITKGRPLVDVFAHLAQPERSPTDASSQSNAPQ